MISIFKVVPPKAFLNATAIIQIRFTIEPGM